MDVIDLPKPPVQAPCPRCGGAGAVPVLTLVVLPAPQVFAQIIRPFPCANYSPVPGATRG